jgi:hypothetical protein
MAAAKTHDGHPDARVNCPREYATAGYLKKNRKIDSNIEISAPLRRARSPTPSNEAARRCSQKRSKPGD